MVGLVILGLMIALMVSYYYVAQKSTSNMIEMIESIKCSVQEENWNDAMVRIEELSASWEKCTVWMAGFVLHGEIDEITLMLSGTYEYARYQKDAEIMRDLALLRAMFERVIKNEHLLFENIL